MIAPDLLVPEVTNAAWRKVLTGDLSLPDAQAMIAQLVQSPSLSGDALNLAAQLSHPAYDCSYLALAMSRRVRMVSADTRLLRRATGTTLASVVVDLATV